MWLGHFGGPSCEHFLSQEGSKYLNIFNQRKHLQAEVEAEQQS